MPEPQISSDCLTMKAKTQIVFRVRGLGSKGTSAFKEYRDIEGLGFRVRSAVLIMVSCLGDSFVRTAIPNWHCCG